MKDLRADIKGNLIWRNSTPAKSVRFESSNDLKKIFENLGSGKHTGDIELDTSNVIVFNGVTKTALMHLIDSLEKGEVNENYTA